MSIVPSNVNQTTYGSINPTDVSNEQIIFSFRYLKIPKYNHKKPEAFCLQHEVKTNHYIALMNRLALYCNTKVVDLKPIPHCHPIDFENHKLSEKCFGIKELDDDTDLKPYQLSIEASKGRIVGGFVGNTFYVRWLDFQHSLYAMKN